LTGYGVLLSCLAAAAFPGAGPLTWNATILMLQPFLAELKRRKVLRVLGVYTAVGWGILQVADQLFPALLLPPWTVTFVAMLLMIGFPVTAIITWAFEITPQGIRRTAAETVEAVPASGSWVELALLIAILATVATSFVQIARRDNTEAGNAPAVDVAPAAATVTASIAVLPFTSFSDAAESNYFADGLTEELINKLAQIEGLAVSGRTSSFYFKNRNEDLRSIGEKLGVAQVLEGSVRRSGDRLRITVQLISTADGFHLWSQTYDRTMTEIFTIQEDVAANVASTLAMKLSPGDQDSFATLRETEDYRLYLVATALLHERSLDTVTRARGLFAQLKERHPDNVDVLAGYTEATMLLAGTYLTVDFDTATREAEATLEHALSLQPDSVAANVAAGTTYTILFHRTDETQYRDRASRAFSRAVELAPDEPGVLAAYGTLLNEMGEYRRALDILRRSVDRDPLSRVSQAQLIMALEGLGRLAEAREKLLTLLQMYPDYAFAATELGELLAAQGQLDAAIPYLQRVHATRTSPRASFMLANLYLNLGLEAELQKTLAELDYSPQSRPLAAAILSNLRGDDATTLELARAELARTNDPIWRSILINAALSLGDLATARQEIDRTEPALLASPEPVPADNEITLFAAELLLREGRPELARPLLASLLVRLAPPEGGYDPVADKLTRARVLACLERRDDALEELRAAHLQGNQLIWDFDFFQRLDHEPAFASLRDDPDFQAIIRDMEAGNRALRERWLRHTSS